MNRRGFLQAFLGVAAGAVLPEPALKFLAANVDSTDAEFVAKANTDPELLSFIALLDKRMKEATDNAISFLNASLYEDGGGLLQANKK